MDNFVYRETQSGSPFIHLLIQDTLELKYIAAVFVPLPESFQNVGIHRKVTCDMSQGKGSLENQMAQYWESAGVLGNLHQGTDRIHHPE